MSSRQQRRELKQFAKQLRKGADDIEALSGPGLLGLSLSDRLDLTATAWGRAGPS